MATRRLTAAQALVEFMSRQFTLIDGLKQPIFAGVFAIFGHGNVAGLGEALYHKRDVLPTYRAHNEQGMAHAAIAFAKATRRRRMMAVTTSIGPGALNLVTAAALAHVNRLPVLLLPGDVFANRRPDPVLQQVEDFGDATISANDCFKPVSRYFDRITRPEQLISALPRAMQVLTDPAECGPVTLALCQDVQAEAYDYPESLFKERLWTPRRICPDDGELAAAIAALKASTAPLIIAGGGVLYSEAEQALIAFAHAHGVPVVETQGGKSSIPDGDDLYLGSVGVTGTTAANALARQADVILAVGTRLQDFTTGSWSLFENPNRVIIGLNVQPFDAGKHSALPLVADAQVGLKALEGQLAGWAAPGAWTALAKSEKDRWVQISAEYTAEKTAAESGRALPSDAEVLGALQAVGLPSDIVVCAAGGLPGELHKHWKAGATLGYHVEYGFSCMGYEIAGGVGVKLAHPQREVIVTVGDGSYLMMNSELATSIMLGAKLTVIVLDNRGYGCINRLQMATGGDNFNNLLRDTHYQELPDIDFATHARALGCIAVKVASLAELRAEMTKARANPRTTVIVIDTDPLASTDAGGNWWDVAVPEVSIRAEVNTARERYVKNLEKQPV